MRVLVTGATGFNAGYLARALSQAGHQVRALVRPQSNFDSLEREGIEIFTGQLLEAADVDRAVQGCDQVYHFAAVFRTANHADSYYYDVNARAVKDVLQAARKHGCERVVHCSTIGVFGDIRNPPANETAPYHPHDVYQRSKLEGELHAKAAIRAGQPVTIVRPAVCYGEGDTRMLKLFSTIHKRQFRIIGTGRNRLHLVHAQDLAEGTMLAGSRPDALGEDFILAGPDAPMLAEVAERIAYVLDVPLAKTRIPMWPVVTAAALCEALCRPFDIDPPLHRRRVSFFANNRDFDISKARSLLGYDPKIDSRAGIARTAAWYFKENLLKGTPPAKLQALVQH